MGTVLYMKRKRLKGNEDLPKPKANKADVVPFPIMEREIENLKTCKTCKRPFREEVCPDCGPDEKEEGG
jgi:hypothetical protein